MASVSRSACRRRSRWSSSVVVAAALPAVEAAYERAMIAEVAALCRHIPHRDLCIQWDVCNEMVIWDGQTTDAVPHADVPRERSSSACSASRAAVPDDVELGLHLCYGDFAGRHFVEPAGRGQDGRVRQCAGASDHAQARLHPHAGAGRAQRRRIPSAVRRPRARGGDRALSRRRARRRRRGARARIAAARRYVPEFGIATECGMARARSQETVLSLLDTHAAVCAGH